MRGALFLLFLIVAVAVSGFGQRITGTIEGRVTDPTGAVLPGVEVTVTNEQTQQNRPTLTNELGLYNVPLLPPGTYSVRISLPGFKTELRRGVIVEVDRNAKVDVRLEIGNVAENVEVTADAPLIQTDTSSLGQVIDTRRVAELPLNGRQFLSLATLTPGVQPNVEGSNLSTQQGSVNVNGAREEFNNFLLDGIDNDDIGNAQLGIVPAIDSIQEFKVQTSNYSAEYGRSAGGLINVTTKSGTNDIHGTAYGFLRHSKLDARNFFANPDLPTPPFEQNQFGGTMGAPIMKNQTFIFGSYERTVVKQAQSATARVPPLDWRNGNFSSLLPSQMIVDPLTGLPFSGNIIPANRFNKIGKAFVDRYPSPNVSGANNLNTTSNLTSYTDNFSARFDHQFTDKDTFFGRYALWVQDRLEPFSRSPTTIPGYGIFLDTESHAWVFNETHVFSPNVVNEFRVGYLRVLGGLYNEQRGSPVAQELGLPVRQVLDPGFARDHKDLTDVPIITATGFNSLQAGGPHIRYDNHFNYIDNFLWTRGGHKMKMGAEIKRTRANLHLTGFAAGQFSFDNRYTGNAIADMLLGYPVQTIRESGDIEDYERAWHMSGYFQDDWKLNNKLTLNLGLRYEVQTPGYEKYYRKASFDPTRGVQVLGGSQAVPADIQAVMAQYPGYAIKDPNYPVNGFKTDYNNFGPRVGFAYDTAGDGKTVVRGGAGVFYIPVLLNKTHGYKRTFPFVVRQNVFSSTDPRNPNVNLNDPFPADLISAGITAGGVNPNLSISYMVQDNLNVQRDLGHSMVLEVGYAGSKGNSLYRSRNVNQALAIPGSPLSIANRRPFPKYGNVGWLEDSANSTYHSMQVRLDRRFVSGVSVLGSYTWSKSIDDNSGSGGASETGGNMNNYNLHLERGLSAFDHRHRATAAVMWQPQIGQSLHGFAAEWAKGWQFNGILTLSSGPPFTPALAGDVSLTGNGNDRPLVTGNSNVDNPDPSGWINKSAFALPTTGVYGNAGRNSITGPGYNDIDFAAFKNFAKGDNPQLVQFRIEIFNLANHPQFFLPNKFMDSPQFGTISRARDPREIQLALRMSF
jgi:hypothetical protein